MHKSLVIALVVAAAAALWVLSGQLGETAPPATKAAKTDAAPPARAVRVATFTARPLRRDIIVRGRTEASRRVELRAETAGRIATLPVEEGAWVRQGAPIATIATAERVAALIEARALLRQREVEHRAAEALAKKGYRADTKLAEAVAQLDAARARVALMQQDMKRTTIRAPFDGRLEHRAVELGGYLKVGDPVGEIVDLDPILVVGDMSERDIDHVKPGQRASATLINGLALEGTIRYVASVANAATRTFKIELEVVNPDGNVRAGVTSEITLPAEARPAHLVSPALLTLDGNGVLGIKAVDDDDRVVFHPVRILSDRLGGIWVDGLPRNARLITVGHEYVRTGQKVRTVPDEAAQPAS